MKPLDDLIAANEAASRDPRYSQPPLNLTDLVEDCVGDILEHVSTFAVGYADLPDHFNKETFERYCMAALALAVEQEGDPAGVQRFVRDFFAFLNRVTAYRATLPEEA